MQGRILENLEPKDLFYYFEEITRIPRGSGNEKKVSDYLVNFAKEHNLEVIQDSALNIIIKKPATYGYENAPTVIIQGHMDMVCEKNIGTEHNFEKDPIKLKLEDDFIKTEGTTLGADNGIAVAMGMAILVSSNIEHPPIEVLLTTEEETGMGGAIALNPEHIKGRILINIDSEEEGKLLVSCAGGIRNKVSLNINWVNANEKLEAYAIKVRGLKGGHSGMDINKGRANSNKVMGRILRDLYDTIEFDLCDLNGGSKNNAIPREADATILLSFDKVSLVKEKIATWNNVLKNEFRTADPLINISLEKCDTKVTKVFSKETLEKSIKLLFLIPNGINSVSVDIKDLVESSTNLGVVTTNTDTLEYDSAVRSSIKSLKAEIVNKTKTIAELLDAEFATKSDYPEWQYNPSSNIRTIFENVHNSMYGKMPEITAIHAGVECGLFEEKFREIDMISFGPNLYDVHTPHECVDVQSVKRSWEYLLNVLKVIK